MKSPKALRRGRQASKQHSLKTLQPCEINPHLVRTPMQVYIALAPNTQNKTANIQSFLNDFSDKARENIAEKALRYFNDGPTETILNDPEFFLETWQSWSQNTTSYGQNLQHLSPGRSIPRPARQAKSFAPRMSSPMQPVGPTAPCSLLMPQAADGRSRGAGT